MHILALGDPMEGFNYIGPFNNSEEAIKYGDAEYSEYAWWVIELTPPNTEITKEPISTTTCIKCGHDKNVHSQNVYGSWICIKCNCRDGGFSESPKPA